MLAGYNSDSSGEAPAAASDSDSDGQEFFKKCILAAGAAAPEEVRAAAPEEKDLDQADAEAPEEAVVFDAGDDASDDAELAPEPEDEDAEEDEEEEPGSGDEPIASRRLLSAGKAFQKAAGDDLKFKPQDKKFRIKAFKKEPVRRQLDEEADTAKGKGKKNIRQYFGVVKAAPMGAGWRPIPMEEEGEKKVVMGGEDATLKRDALEAMGLLDDAKSQKAVKTGDDGGKGRKGAKGAKGDDWEETRSITGAPKSRQGGDSKELADKVQKLEQANIPAKKKGHILGLAAEELSRIRDENVKDAI